MPNRRRDIFRYGVMLLSVGVAFTVANFIPQLRERESFVVFLGAIMLSAWYGGWGPGVIGSLLSAGLVNYYIVQPPGEFTFNEETVVTHLGFLLVAVMICYLNAQRAKAQEAAEQQQKKLQSLASELSLAEERERRNLAACLHDRVGQSLALARIKLLEFRTRVDPAALEQFDELPNLLKQILIETRSLTFELSPPILYEFGLDAALEWLCEHFKKDHSLNCSYVRATPIPPLQLDRRVTLFQAVRELLTNIVKHANASHATVRVEQIQSELNVTVVDDGIGMNTALLTGVASKPDVFGLFSIDERIRHLGGTMRVDSRQGQGTQVTLVMTLSENGK